MAPFPLATPMLDAITGGNDIGLWALWWANIPKKCGNIDWNMKNVIFGIVMKSHFWNMMLHNTKDRNLSRKCTSLIRRQNHNGELVDRRLCFPPQICV